MILCAEAGCDEKDHGGDGFLRTVGQGVEARDPAGVAIRGRHRAHPVVDDDQPRRIVEVERDEVKKLLHQMGATLRDVDGVECKTRVISAAEQPVTAWDGAPESQCRT